VIILALIFLGVYWCGRRQQEQKQQDQGEPSWLPPESQAHEPGRQEWKGIEMPTQANVAELPSANDRW